MTECWTKYLIFGNGQKVNFWRICRPSIDLGFSKVLSFSAYSIQEASNCRIFCGAAELPILSNIGSTSVRSRIAGGTTSGAAAREDL